MEDDVATMDLNLEPHDGAPDMPEQEPDLDDCLWGRVRPAFQDLLPNLRPDTMENETEEEPSRHTLFGRNTDSYLYGFLPHGTNNSPSIHSSA